MAKERIRDGIVQVPVQIWVDEPLYRLAKRHAAGQPPSGMSVAEYVAFLLAQAIPEYDRSKHVRFDDDDDEAGDARPVDVPEAAARDQESS